MDNNHSNIGNININNINDDPNFLEQFISLNDGNPQFIDSVDSINSNFIKNSNQSSNASSDPSLNLLEIKKNKIKKHSKSKAGCNACKERKIKCDQKIPICSNCIKRNIECPYLFMTPFQIHNVEEKQKKLKIQNNNILPLLNYHQYKIDATIDLNTEDHNLLNSTYHASELENMLLSQSNVKSNFSNLFDDTNTTTTTNINNFKINKNLNSNLISINSNSKQLPLYINSKKSNRIFSTDHSKIIKFIEFTYTNMIKLSKALFTSDVEMMINLANGSQLDYFIYLNYIEMTSISQLFNKLLRKSFLLLSMDYYKNTILKQNMISFATYKEKLLISSICENLSVISIDEITHIIKNDYLPFFNDFYRGARNLFLGSFLILDDCLGFHFKNGLKFDMSFDEGNNAIKLVGIFSTGMYSIIMARSDEIALFTSTNMFSSYLVTIFRRILTKNYNLKIFENFLTILNKFSNDFNNDINFENLKLFCEKHLPLLKSNIHNDSLLGFNNGYIIRIFNSFKSIIPYNIINFSKGNPELFKDRELDILIFFFYSTFSHILDVLIPGRSIICGSFSGSEMDIFNFGNTSKFMKLFSYIKNKKLKLAAIYLIRTGLFIKWQWSCYKVCLSNLSLSILLDDNNEMSINERYLKLKSLKFNGVVDELPVSNFSLEKGQFFKKWNYPNYLGRKKKRIDRILENKIVNFFNHNDDDLINDFIKTNTGFFSMDYDITNDDIGNDSMVMRTEFVNQNQIKILWKLITYIRINNL
ncbi:hypothetical protein C6P40_001546 [Pichia californica]|uniref:Zn(2)-C6 fungal-type domain-containing protein n=1 Tax=Pichia californica TaxID=460514 RepID=A0A9P6WKX7_9ASCO|nr:hypothetical protein C6P40_001546 [[Candida] californica]